MFDRHNCPFNRFTDKPSGIPAASMLTLSTDGEEIFMEKSLKEMAKKL
jgi:hypothetical protein